MKVENKIFSKLLRLPKVLRNKDFYYPVSYKCQTLTLGNKGNDWTIHPDKIDDNSIIYSFGVGVDISFDLLMIDKYGCQIHAFDPTPKTKQWLYAQELPDKFRFFDIGLADYNGNANFQLPANPEFVSGVFTQDTENAQIIEVKVKRLKTIMQQLGHSHIDLLKMDIEGAEYDVIESIIEDNLSIGQILVEFHHRFPEHGIHKTKKSIRRLSEFGFQVFCISANGEEYSFMKK